MLRITIVCQCVLGKFMKWKCFSFSTSSQTNIAKYRHPAYIRYSLTENGEYAHGTIPCVQARAGKTDVRKLFWVTNYTRKTFSCFCEIFCNFIVILPHFPEVFSEMFLYVSDYNIFAEIISKGQENPGKNVYRKVQNQSSITITFRISLTFNLLSQCLAKSYYLNKKIILYVRILFSSTSKILQLKSNSW